MADTTTASQDKQPVRGSCHCGHISYTILLPPSVPQTVGRCNCTMCLKPGFTSLHIPASDFTLVSPAEGEAGVGDYQFRSKDVHRFFCAKCGVQVWGRGQYEHNGAQHEFFSVNAATIEQPQEGVELDKWKIRYCAGRDDSFRQGDVPFEGGMP